MPAGNWLVDSVCPIGRNRMHLGGNGGPERKTPFRHTTMKKSSLYGQPEQNKCKVM